MSDSAQMDYLDRDNEVLPYAIPLELRVQDPEIARALCEYPDGPLRQQFALSALRIGVLALKQAQGQVDVAAVQKEMDRIVAGLKEQLNGHAVKVQTELSTTLKEYFDPESGRFHERVRQLTRADGELEQVLRRQVGGDDSQLTKTLMAYVGRESPLLKMLDPKESDGLLSALRKSLDEELGSQRRQILDQFSLDNKEGALARLIKELQENHGELNTALQEKIQVVVKEFSLDDENSALSRLVSNVAKAQRTITSEFSLDNKESSLARMKNELLEVLKEHDEDNQNFREEVKVALASMVARQTAEERSTQHGVAFEDAVREFIFQQAQQVGDVAQGTGNTTGLIKNCKVGDCVVELGPDTAAAGTRFVVEAKEKVNYSLAAAREESDVARKNRNAQMCLFIFSSKTAPAELEPFARYGNDVVVVWDPEQPATDVYVKAGVTTVRALCVREAQRREGQDADFTAIDQAILEIEKRSNKLRDIKDWTGNIRRDADKIWELVRKSYEALDRQVEQLRDKVADVRMLTEDV
ncbi:MAG: hypothetical protein WBF93_12270 [Pirellulales bacterium]